MSKPKNDNQELLDEAIQEAERQYPAIWKYFQMIKNKPADEGQEWRDRMARIDARLTRLEEEVAKKEAE